jgi:phytoene dehydrogenase-like protein
MKLYDKTGTTMVEVQGIDKRGEDLALQTNLMESMPADVYVRPEEVWIMVRMAWKWKIISYLPAFLWKSWTRRNKLANEAKAKAKAAEAKKAAAAAPAKPGETAKPAAAPARAEAPKPVEAPKHAKAEAPLAPGEYDIIVVGAGNNGLIVAGYLAKAGLKTCVLESRDFIGGGVVTREVTAPGFKHDLGATAALWVDLNPIVQNDELGLVKKYGLKFLPIPEVQEVIIFPDDRNICIYHDLDKTCASIAKISQKDADQFNKYVKWATPFFKPVLRGSNMPPAPFGNFLSMLAGSSKGVELLRTTLMNAVDAANEWFSSDEMKIAATRWAAQTRISPMESGTAEGIEFMAPFSVLYGAKPIEGGAGRFTECLGMAIKDFGSEIRLNAKVKEVLIKDNRALGVILESGETIRARKGVVLGLNIKQIFPLMTPGAQLPNNFVRDVQRLKPQRVQYLTWHAALNNAPVYKAGGDVNRGYQVQPFPTANYEEYLDGLTDMYRGHAKTNSPGIICSTLFDPSRAPAGKHTLWIAHQEPFYLEGGPQKWDEIKQQVRDGIVATVQKHTTNMTASNIIAEKMFTPLDYSRWNPAWIEGDPSHIGGYLNQYMSNRPLPGWGGYKMPVDGLYLCGPSTHPGTGLNAGARAPANVIMKDLGIEFDKVI